MSKRSFPYPGLILKLGSHVAGLALAFRDELFKSQSVVLPHGEADIPQHEQNQFDILLCKGSDEKFEYVEDEERMHHLEVIQVTDNGDQVVALLAIIWVLVQLVELSHDRLQKMGPHLGNDKFDSCYNYIYVREPLYAGPNVMFQHKSATQVAPV